MEFKLLNFEGEHKFTHQGATWVTYQLSIIKWLGLDLDHTYK